MFLQILLFWYLDNLSVVNMQASLILSMLSSFWKSTWREGSETGENGKIQYNVIFSHHGGIVDFFNRYYICLIKLSVWSRSHINMTFPFSIVNLFYVTDLTRNPEFFWNTVFILVNIWGLCRLSKNNFVDCVENRKLPWWWN